MSKQGNRYAAEFRRQMVELVRAGRGSEELAREFEPVRSKYSCGFPMLAFEYFDRTTSLATMTPT